MSNEFEQPWDVIADYFTKTGVTLQEARDRVILAWLKDGNVDPYCDWVSCGHTPSHRVAMLVSRMMQKAKASGADQFADLQCGLAISADGRTLPDKEGEARKFLAGRHSLILEAQAKNSNRKATSKRSDAAAADLASNIPLANNVTIGPSTVRQIRMQLQRGLKDGVMPEILRGLICLD